MGTTRWGVKATSLSHKKQSHWNRNQISRTEKNRFATIAGQSEGYCQQERFPRLLCLIHSSATTDHYSSTLPCQPQKFADLVLTVWLLQPSEHMTEGTYCINLTSCVREMQAPRAGGGITSLGLTCSVTRGHRISPSCSCCKPYNSRNKLLSEPQKKIKR